MTQTPSIKEALTDLISLCERNLYPQPDKPNSDWMRVQAAKTALATFQPSGEGREALVTQVQGILGDKLTIDALNVEIDGVGPASYAIVDLLLASGLVQDEAEWLDISTAPKNEYVLVFCPDAEESSRMICGLLVFEGDPEPPDWYELNGSKPLDVEPSHWKPLPTSPIRSARNGGAES